MPFNFESWHVGAGTGVVGLIVLGLIWRFIKLIMKIILFFFVLALAGGAYLFYEYHKTGQLPFGLGGH